MFLEKILKKITSSFAAKRPPATYSHAIIDLSDDTLVAISPFLPAIVFVNESMMDTVVHSDILSPEAEYVKTLEPRMYPEWSWYASKRTFKKTNPVLVTEDMRERAVLASKKVEAISRALYSTNFWRSKLETGLFFQNVIYAEKERQARLLKDAHFEKNLIPHAPYVAHYAEDNNISLTQAADEILLQAKLDHELLAKTERTRLVLFKKIRLAKTPAEVDDILKTYRSTGVV